MESNKNSIQGLKILSLDDNAIDNGILTELLKDTGAMLQTTSSVVEAYELIEENKYDVLLIDHMMPESDGITVLKRIRELHLCDNSPIIAVTGNNISSARANYLNAGFADYIAKPINKDVLIRSISRSLNTKSEDAIDDDKQRILIIDDNQMNLLLARKILSEEYNVSVVSSANAGLIFLEETIPDMILLDLHMPGIDGFQFLEIINQDDRYKDIPIICLTADDDHDSELRCFELGALDFITKPFIAEIMRRRVERILELSRLQHDLQLEVEKKTEKLHKHTKKLERMTDEVMLTLASTIDAKDKYTNGHSVRVAEYSRLIAKMLNMSRQEQDDIYRMGLLHDIGKIGVPDEIINKTSRLTDEEYAVIKTHPIIGAEILENMSELPDIAIGAKYHHERYDGNGYPEGLSGENIPLVARIIGVADAYDAMTSNRSYREVMPQNVVRNEIVKGKGTQFDPVFAEIMLKVIDEDKEYNLREKK